MQKSGYLAEVYENRSFILCILLGALLMLAGSFFVGGRVEAVEKRDEQAMESYYRVLEKEYREKVEAVLDEEGYKDAGIMLTRTRGGSEGRNYSLAIHHRRFGRKVENDEKLIERLEELELGIDESSISIMTTN